MVTRPGSVQLYCCAAPLVRCAFWMRVLTTSNGVLNVVPSVPPMKPAMKLFRSVSCLVYPRCYRKEGWEVRC